MFRVHGHERAVQFIQRGLEKGRLHHAYLLTGPTHVGKSTLALQMAQAVNCEGQGPPCGECGPCLRIAQGNHADVQTLELATGEEGANRTLIGIEAVRDLHAAAHLRPYEGRHRVFIIQQADKLSQEAANALLKTLEEPPPDVLLVLLTEDPEAVIPTVASRCQRLELRPLSASALSAVLRDEHGVEQQEAEELSRLARGCSGWAIQAAQGSALLSNLHQRLERIADVCRGRLEARFTYAGELARRFQRDRREGRDELFLWLRWWRDVLLIQQGRGDQIAYTAWRESLEDLAHGQSAAALVRWLHRIFETVEALERNANSRLALEVMMLELPAAAGAGVRS
jgi:DNA polymerase-3 subunit delta'